MNFYDNFTKILSNPVMWYKPFSIFKENCRIKSIFIFFRNYKRGSITFFVINLSKSDHVILLGGKYAGASVDAYVMTPGEGSLLSRWVIFSRQESLTWHRENRTERYPLAICWRNYRWVYYFQNGLWDWCSFLLQVYQM